MTPRRLNNLKENCSRLKKILMSAYDDDEFRVDGYECIELISSIQRAVWRGSNFERRKHPRIKKRIKIICRA